MPHSPEDKKRILTRVRRIRGQVEALERALASSRLSKITISLTVTGRDI